MTRGLLVMTSAVALAAALAGASPALAQDAREPVVMPAPSPFSANDLLWFEVRADDALLTESMDAYASRAGVFLPLGQFARVLDLAIGVMPEQGRAEGWILDRGRGFELDLAKHVAVVAGKDVTFDDTQAAVFEGDIYLRLDLIEKLLPVTARADIAAQLLRIAPTEPLPFQERLALEARRRGLSEAGDTSVVTTVVAPYLAFSPPSFDVNIGGQMARDGRDQSRRFDVRAAGDLAYAGFQGFVGSNDRGEINDVRVLLERHDADGAALAGLGPLERLKATRVGLGDVFSPPSPLGPSSASGRGVFYSSAPLESLDLSTPLDLRGELAVGEEVELYVNETLRGSQATPVEGRYAFLNVPLSVGLNTIRLVFYGSQGQRREEARRINVGAGQAAAGAFVVRLAALQQGRTVIDPVVDRTDPSIGDPRLILLVDYGLNSSLTLSGGLTRFTPLGLTPRSTASGGLRASVAGAALQLDVAMDDRNGRGATMAVAARPGQLALTARHSTYSGGFVDETRQPLATDGLRLSSTSEANASTALQFSDRLVMPLAVEWRQMNRVDGSRRTTIETRTSAAVGRYYLSAALFNDRETGALRERNDLGGRLDAATLINRDIQFRAGLSYRSEADLGFDSAYASADIRMPHNDTLHLGVIRAAGGRSTLQASYLRRTRAFDIAANASYETGANAWRIGLQLGFAFGYDPGARGYRFMPPGVASSGAAVINAFEDRNNDGRRQPDEPGLPGVKIDTPTGPVVSDDAGRALASRLGDGAKVKLRIDTDDLDDPFLAGGADVVSVAPRMGRTIVVDYPMARRSEVELTVMLQRSGDATERPLAAGNFELVPEDGGATLAAQGVGAGVAFVEGAAAGRYTVRLQAQQAAGLGMVLVGDAATITAPAAGGFVDGGKIVVRFKGDVQ